LSVSYVIGVDLNFSCNSVLDSVQTVLSALLHPGSPDTNTINDAYDCFGPISRICLEIASSSDELNVYKDQVQNNVHQLTLPKLKEMVFDLQNLIWVNFYINYA
jgi:hypothetical protein